MPLVLFRMLLKVVENKCVAMIYIDLKIIAIKKNSFHKNMLTLLHGFM